MYELFWMAYRIGGETMTLLLGFGHKARQGKDEAANAILNYYIQKYTILSGWTLKNETLIKIGIFKYATALYREVEGVIGAAGGAEQFFAIPSLFPVPNGYPLGGHIQVPDWVTIGDLTPVPMAKYGKHPKLLQWWGTEYRRKYFGEDYWVKKLAESIPANLDIAMVTDVRFLNEAQYITARAGYTVKIERLNADGTPYVAPDRPFDHPSETALDGYNFDFRLTNTHGHQALLGEQAITLVEYLRGLHK